MNMPRFELEVCVRGIPGIVDSEWIPLTSGISVLTGRNNVGKSRVPRTISAQQIGARLHDGDISIVMETDRVGFPYHYAVIGLGGTSHAPQFARAIEGLSEILPVSFTVCLDGDAASKYYHLPHTRFLAVNELEEVFLADPHAIRECVDKPQNPDIIALGRTVSVLWPINRNE